MRRPEETPMTRRGLLLAAALPLLAPLAAAASPVRVGAAITVAEATPMADILRSPADYEGKTVRVEGEVRGVCTRMGCWMDLADPAGNRIRIQVEDGVMVFPSDAAGRPAVAQGTVTVQELSREQYVAWRRHLAEEGAAPFDEASVGQGPFSVVQIAGSGATVGE
jgi:hypothetical protein